MCVCQPVIRAYNLTEDKLLSPLPSGENTKKSEEKSQPGTYTLIIMKGNKDKSKKVNAMSDVYDNVWESRKRKPPAREEKKLPEVKPPFTDRERLKDTIERRKKNVYGMK